ncbi:DNA mismatch repair protein MutS [Pseudobutyrivibrio xylanivorans]|uniref:DNA mismatch repair protein MutS n=1 Tax=Pseudobutyrivibrio xylanivorans DSM 14809 TaxID=1123012 RepID=A0A1M6I7X4_PSEXY|nr:DNA mismatch repair protein MutS [Pseudobutyrivibrio xylanivorans]SHJ30532.1 DNA mismatch repair protein MutS [Pseudobutyrivibrio xylanivorans DSM 14809]
MAEYTPMMQEYLKTKAEYEDCILFYRLGDFYEMFFEDAKTASRELELTLTGKSCGMEERAPMCGVPFHAADSYINRLVSRGYKVAICEQVEDPKEAKGLVKREVIRVVTPGTNIDQMALDEGSNNYIMSIFYNRGIFGVSSCDISTADFYLTEVDSIRKLIDELYKFNPAEIIYSKSIFESGIDITEVSQKIESALSQLDESFYDDTLSTRELLNHFHAHSLEGLGLMDFQYGRIAAGALLSYLKETQKSELAHLTHITPYTDGKYMLLDNSTRRNLELTETMRDKQKRGSLLWVLDKTKTAMGARQLKSFIEQPLVSVDEIIKRQDAISEINESLIDREELREYLSSVYDLERLITKITYQSANPRDLIAFKQSIGMLTPIKTLLSGFHCHLLDDTNSNIDDMKDLFELIDSAIDDEPPISSRDGDIIKAGFNEEVDRLRAAKVDGKQWLADLEAKERDKTGIKNLKIKFNKVFGFYLEVTNSYKDLVPDYYIRKQTLANAERYYTPELKELEDSILGAEDRLNTIEYEFFKTVRDTIASNVDRIQITAKAIALLDAIISMAVVAEKNHYVRPVIDNRGIIDIKDGRHPVVEQMINADQFISNDCELDLDSRTIAIITGPNMAGKSTYMRQVALIVLMAQIGSFVPASEARIGVVDRIFTRVGASDDLSTGQSTFMVEMNEVANILHNATNKSLLILDEIGRGTSTYDGLSIAWAVVEHIAYTIGAKTLFATHYHELTELEGQIKGVHNYCIAVQELGEDIIFLRKIIPGGADQSYGIQVARLAGLPEEVLSRARTIVNSLNENDIAAVADRISIREQVEEKLKSLEGVTISENEAEIIAGLRELDVTKITPLEAMNILFEFHNKVNE